MFVLKESFDFTREVEIEDPDGNKSSFEVLFRELTPEKAKPFIVGDAIKKEMVHEAVIGWNGLYDPDKNPIPYNRENLDALIDRTWLIEQVLEVYLHSLLGVRKAGNSKTSPDTLAGPEKKSSQ